MMLGWEKFQVLELVGFGMLVLGTIVYNEIWIVPCHLLSKNTKANLEKNKVAFGDAYLANSQKNYIATSPQAGYDANRNRRNIERELSKDTRR